MKKLYLDFDGTVVNSVKSFCRTYHKLYKTHPDYIVPQWYLVNEWNFQDQCHLLQGTTDVEKIFGMQLFFENLEFIDEYTYEILKELNEQYQIIICSIGTYDNISLKSQWIKDNIPFIKDSIFLVNVNSTMNKSSVNMQDSIFIDDVAINLNSSNADLKLCFGDVKSWNKDWDGVRIFNWKGIKELLL